MSGRVDGNSSINRQIGNSQAGNSTSGVQDNRINRVNNLDDLILRADVTTAEKFRKVFEAYQIEANFGKSIENYPGYILLDNTEFK